jgi:hypothetical protein
VSGVEIIQKNLHHVKYPEDIQMNHLGIQARAKKRARELQRCPGRIVASYFDRSPIHRLGR